MNGKSIDFTEMLKPSPVEKELGKKIVDEIAAIMVAYMKTYKFPKNTTKTLSRINLNYLQQISGDKWDNAYKYLQARLDDVDAMQSE